MPEGALVTVDTAPERVIADSGPNDDQYSVGNPTVALGTCRLAPDHGSDSFDETLFQPSLWPDHGSLSYHGTSGRIVPECGNLGYCGTGQNK